MLNSLDVKFVTEAAIAERHGGSGEQGATILKLLDDSTSCLDCGALVLATTNVSETWLADELRASGQEIHSIRDRMALRAVNFAFYEGRKLGLAL